MAREEIRRWSAEGISRSENSEFVGQGTTTSPWFRPRTPREESNIPRPNCTPSP